MTMNDIVAKLRKRNIKNYYMLLFSTVLSVLLVTSYALMFFSPTVQNILPIGGDSRKQAGLIFGIAVIGCGVFTTYASTLFFKYKSREYGIFMALGEKKSKLKKVLMKELLVIIPLCFLTGLALSVPVSFGIWKTFQLFIVDTKEMAYSIGWSGFLYGLAFCIFILFCMISIGGRFIKRSNVIEIIYEQRKSEVIKDVKSWTGMVGWILVVVGIILGYMIPQISITYFEYFIPSMIGSSLYTISLVGIYMVMLHTVINSKKGKNPKKYYKNIISSNMMRFSGRQTVKNMCVISLLIAGALFASFYTPTLIAGSFKMFKNSPVDYSFFYDARENQISKEEIFALAKKHAVDITTYEETQSMRMIINGEKSDMGEDRRIVREAIEKIGYGEFFSESEFNRISKQQISVNQGDYLKIILPEETENIWTKFDELNLITHPITDQSTSINYAGTVKYAPFVTGGKGNYIISDEDYTQLSQGLSKDYQDQFVLFNVENPQETYGFAKELKNEIVLRSSLETAVIQAYDAYERKVAIEKGEDYWADQYTVELSPDNTQLYLDWKYYPSFGVLDKQDMVKNMAVFLMLFIYIAIVCLAAVGVIAYTRSITIGMDNKGLFSDLKKLGANNHYIERVIKKQLTKIFIYPTAVGSISMYMLYVMILVGNSGGISGDERIALQIDLCIITIVLLFMYLVYRMALSKVKKMVQI